MQASLCSYTILLQYTQYVYFKIKLTYTERELVSLANDEEVVTIVQTNAGPCVQDRGQGGDEEGGPAAGAAPARGQGGGIPGEEGVREVASEKIGNPGLPAVKIRDRGRV